MSDKQVVPGTFCWNELHTGDSNKAKHFYESLLGWTSEDLDMGEGGTYTMFKTADGEDASGMMQIPSEQQAHMPPHWMSYIAVESIDVVLEKAVTLGAKIVVPKTPAGEYGIFAVVADPTGAHIAFWQKLP